MQHSGLMVKHVGFGVEGCESRTKGSGPKP